MKLVCPRMKLVCKKPKAPPAFKAKTQAKAPKCPKPFRKAVSPSPWPTSSPSWPGFQVLVLRWPLAGLKPSARALPRRAHAERCRWTTDRFKVHKGVQWHTRAILMSQVLSCLELKTVRSRRRTESTNFFEENRHSRKAHNSESESATLNPGRPLSAIAPEALQQGCWWLNSA